MSESAETQITFEIIDIFETAKTALRAAIVEISKAGTKGVYHKKTVSRKISRLSKAVSSIA